jgi:phosphomannomutase
MADAPLIVGVSGLRGIVGESLTPEVAVRYAGALGSWLNERAPGCAVVVARDGRAHGRMLYDAAISALMATGCEVIPAGVAMTPSVGAYLHSMEAPPCAGVIVTASHNPQQWNGLKALVSTDLIDPETPDAGAAAPPASVAAEIIERFESGRIDWCAREEMTEPEREMDITTPHCVGVRDAVMQRCGHFDESRMARGLFGETGRPWRVVVDSVNASGARAVGAFFRWCNARAIQIAGDESGLFPHVPEPTAENLAGEGGLCDAVPGLKADIGFAQDPDADRLAIVDEKGRYIGEEYTLVLCAEALLSARHGGDGEAAPVLVANLSTSRMIDDVAAKYGGRVVRTPVGEANVVEAMKRLRAEGEDVVLGGEGNGGVIWPEVTYVRDSLGAMALVLSLMARTGKTVSELVAGIDACSPGGGGYAIVKRKVDIPSKAAAGPAVEKVARHYGGDRGRAAGAAVDLQDGVRVDFRERGVWVHVRASNTEPIMRLIAEAPTPAAAEAILAEVAGVIG